MRLFITAATALLPCRKSPIPSKTLHALCLQSAALPTVRHAIGALDCPCRLGKHCDCGKLEVMGCLTGSLVGGDVAWLAAAAAP